MKQNGVDPKPKHLAPEYATTFKDRGIVGAYQRRPLYTPEVFEILVDLIEDEPRVVLDIGCGTGDIARQMVDHVERVDAVDFSHPMIERGKSLPNGNHTNINWIHGPAETARLNPPYGLVVAGDSIGWFDWTTVFRRFKESLTPTGKLAIVSRDWGIDRELEGGIFSRYSTNKDYAQINVVHELEVRGLFNREGERSVGPVSQAFTVDEYIESRHSQQSFSRERMGQERAAEFDNELRAVWAAKIGPGKFDIQISMSVVWGRPSA